jgi:hypothetical protein
MNALRNLSEQRVLSKKLRSAHPICSWDQDAEGFTFSHNIKLNLPISKAHFVAVFREEVLRKANLYYTKRLRLAKKDSVIEGVLGKAQKPAVWLPFSCDSNSNTTP